MPVPPLQVPDLSRFGDVPRTRLVHALSQYSAVRLFTDRAAAVQPGFHLTPETATVLVSICERLDGMPLALELAAARLRLMSIEALRDRLAQADAPRFLDFLGAGRRDAPRRHRTIAAAIDWSYGTLAEPEQRLFRAVGVCAGGWTIEMLGAMTPDVALGAPADPDQAMASLTAKSLVYRVDAAEGSTRWSMQRSPSPPPRPPWPASSPWRDGSTTPLRWPTKACRCCGAAGRRSRSWRRSRPR